MKKIFGLIVGVVLVFLASTSMARENKLIIWSHWVQEPVKINFMNAVAKEFEKEDGTPVEIVWMEKTELTEKLKVAFNTPEPDLSYLDVGLGHPRIVRSLLDLSELKFSGQTYSDWRLGDIGEHKAVFLPIEGVSNAMYYNKDLFAQANIVLPQDRLLSGEEFLEIIRTLRSSGIIPIGEGASDRAFKLGIPFMNVIFRFAGPEKIAQLLRGEINFSDPGIVAALDFWKQVVDARGYDNEKAATLSMLDGIFEVTDGHAAISFCGTWIYSKFGTTERDKGQIGVLDWFTVENGEGNDFYEIVWVAGYGINRNSQHLDTAKKFLEFLMTPTAASLWAKHVQGPYPVITENLPSDTLYGSLAQRRKDQQAFTQLFSYPYFGSKAANNMWNAETRKFILGERTVEEFVRNMNSRLE